jgi:hypothetical protein
MHYITLSFQWQSTWYWSFGAAAAKNRKLTVAMTDTANMMGAFHFVSAVMNHNKAAAKTQP